LIKVCCGEPYGVKFIYQDKNRLPTMAIIHQEMKERLNVTVSQEQIRRIMRETGFTWKNAPAIENV